MRLVVINSDRVFPSLSLDAHRPPSSHFSGRKRRLLEIKQRKGSLQSSLFVRKVGSPWRAGGQTMQRGIKIIEMDIELQGTTGH